MDDLVLPYVILMHNAPESMIRLMESVYITDITKFMIHVDGKEKSNTTHKMLVE